MNLARNNKKRQQLIDKAVKTGVVVRVLSIIASLATVPLVMNAISLSDFSVWATITSMLSMMLFLDFGIGNSAMGKITEALAHNNYERATRLVRHAYFVLLSISLILIFFVVTMHTAGLLEAVALNTGSFLKSHISLVAGFLICYAFAIPATFIQRLLFAHQQAGLSAVLQFVFSLAYLCLTIIFSWAKLNLEVFVLSYVILLVAVYGGYSWYFLSKNYPTLQILGEINRSIVISLLKGAGLFFLLQITVSIVYNSDTLILTAISTQDEVAMYAIAWRMFSLVMMVNGLILGPMWPAITDAKAKNDWFWIKKAYFFNRKRSFFVSISLAALLSVFGNTLLRYWTGGRIEAPLILMIFMGVWVVLEGYGQCMAMLLNGLQVLRLQIISAVLLLCLGTLFKLYLTTYVGIYGPVIGTIAGFLIFVFISQTLFIKKLFERKV
jgi:O-antigen/teichoic acid export membrane protein